VEWTEEALEELRALKVFDQRAVLRAVAALAYQAETQTRHRRPLREPLADLPGATWELRVRARHRILYCIHRVSAGDGAGETVEILRATIKEGETTAEAVRRQR
jgi:hypothetical protein